LSSIRTTSITTNPHLLLGRQEDATQSQILTCRTSPHFNHKPQCPTCQKGRRV
jgi:hypothetical protein